MNVDQHALAVILGAVAVLVVAFLPPVVFDHGTFVSTRDWSWGTALGDGLRMLFVLQLVTTGGSLRKLAEDRLRKVVALEAERDEAARQAVTDERGRIARELHDVVAHHVSLIVVQSDGAAAVMKSDPKRAADALGVISRTGRAALTELRRLLGVLREQEGLDPSAPTAPQPGLAEVERLVENVRSSGVEVEVACEGLERALPQGVDLTVYRIVQEALTNVVKHARGSRAQVMVRYHDDAVEVEVLNDGGSPHAGAAEGSGVGLIGMRERVSVFGGRLETAPMPGGGYRVWARLPTAEVPA